MRRLSPRIAAALGLLLPFLLARPAAACSVAKGYRVPSNFELVQKADLIVVGRINGATARHGDDEMPSVLIKPVRTLKGIPPRGPMKLLGQIGQSEWEMPSMPSALSVAHVTSMTGSCIRMLFPHDGLVLAMFVGTKDAEKKALEGAPDYIQLFQPFARVAEDVEDENGVWPQAVQDYVRLQAQPPGDMAAAIEARRQALLARGDMVARTIAEDLRGDSDRLRGVASDDSTPSWRTVDIPLATFSRIGVPDASRHGVLICEPGKGLRVGVGGQPAVRTLTLIIGDRRYDSEALAPEEPRDGNAFPERDSVLVGALRTAPDALDSMLTETKPSGIELPGGAHVLAPPLDHLAKFAARCKRLLAGER